MFIDAHTRACLRTALYNHGLVFAPFAGIEEDSETFTLMVNGMLPDPSREPYRVVRQLQHVLIVKGYRVEETEGESPLISALIGIYRTRPTEVFLGRHDNREWISDLNYRLPYADLSES